jgi:hypothetical protein
MIQCDVQYNAAVMIALDTHPMHNSADSRSLSLTLSTAQHSTAQHSTVPHHGLRSRRVHEVKVHKVLDP